MKRFHPLTRASALILTLGGAASLAASHVACTASPAIQSDVAMSDDERFQLLMERWEARKRARPAEDITGRVTEVGGEPIQGVKVSVADQAAWTDADGYYSLPGVSLGLHVITFQHNGYVTRREHALVRPFQVPQMSAQLLKRGSPHTVSPTKEIRVSDGDVTVDFPAHSLVFKDDGTEPLGDVTIQLTAINPTLPDHVWAAPAALMGVKSTGEMTALRSFYMLDVEMRQGERELEIRPGTFASASVVLAQNAGVKLGDRIPMWHADERTGLWVEESGVEAVIEEKREERYVARAALPHFTAWNLDAFTDTVVAQLTFVASDAESIEYIRLLETAYADPATNPPQWSTPVGSAWAQKSFPALQAQDTARFFMNLPQCGSDWKHKFKLQAKFSGDLNHYDLTINPPSGQGFGSCVFGSSSAARVEFTSGEVCSFLNCIGANRNASNVLVPPEDGNLYGLKWGNFLNSSTQIDNSLGITTWTNGQDGRGVIVNNSVRSLAMWRLPFDYTVGNPLKAFPGNDPGFNAYKSISTNPADAFYNDIDKDGIKDLIDNCVSHPNASQADVNKNGIGDVCEDACFVSPTDLDASDYDFDGDAIDDICDTKPSIWNPSQAP